jgi:hypothetical protein
LNFHLLMCQLNCRVANDDDGGGGGGGGGGGDDDGGGGGGGGGDDDDDDDDMSVATLSKAYVWAARLLGSRVQNPLRAWVFISCVCSVVYVEASDKGRSLDRGSLTDCVRV